MLEWLWELLRAQELDRRHRQHTAEIAAQKRRLEDARSEDDKRRDQDSIDTLMTLWLISEVQRQSLKELWSDVADAITATRAALERAQRDQEKARLALAEVRQAAITLPDGRRVYFSADGQRLYAEDHSEIVNESDLNEAWRAQQNRPNAPTHEAYVESQRRFHSATQAVQNLANALDKLDDIHKALERGDLTEDELAGLRRQHAEIIENLPADARQEYEQLRKGRENARPAAYRGLDAATEAALDLTGHFSRAVHTVEAPVAAAPKTEGEERITPAKAAYTAAPDF